MNDSQLDVLVGVSHYSHKSGREFAFLNILILTNPARIDVRGIQLAAACRDPLSPAASYPQCPVLSGTLQAQRCNTALGSRLSWKRTTWYELHGHANQQPTSENLLNFCYEIRGCFFFSLPLKNNEFYFFFSFCWVVMIRCSSYSNESDRCNCSCGPWFSVQHWLL